MNLPAGVKQGGTVEVSPKSAPLSTPAIEALARQRRREAEDMEAILAKREQADREQAEGIRRAAEARAQAERVRREQAEQERQEWAEINARLMPNGQPFPLAQAPYLADEGITRIILCDEPLRLPMLVDGDLVVSETGVTLKVSELVSPIIPAAAAALLADVYRDAAFAGFLAQLDRTRELMGDGATLYTAALPTVTVTDAGPASARTSHKVLRAHWGDCYLHQPVR